MQWREKNQLKAELSCLVAMSCVENAFVAGRGILRSKNKKTKRIKKLKALVFMPNVSYQTINIGTFHQVLNSNSQLETGQFTLGAFSSPISIWPIHRIFILVVFLFLFCNREARALSNHLVFYFGKRIVLN